MICCRRLMWTIAAVCCAIGTQTAWGGEPLFYLPGATSDVNDRTMCGYPSCGITFVMARNGRRISEVVVYPQGKPTVRGNVEPDQIVAGRGAFGVKLGDTVADINRLGNVVESSWSTYQEADIADRAALQLEDGRMLFAFFKDGKVQGLIATGPFRSPEGVTERSSESVIVAAYGLPEVFWMARPSFARHSGGFVLPACATGGLVGLGIAVYALVRRCRHSQASGGR